jgi:hypothetical protein
LVFGCDFRRAAFPAFLALKSFDFAEFRAARSRLFFDRALRSKAAFDFFGFGAGGRIARGRGGFGVGGFGRAGLEAGGRGGGPGLGSATAFVPNVTINAIITA